MINSSFALKPLGYRLRDLPGLDPARRNAETEALATFLESLTPEQRQNISGDVLLSLSPRLIGLLDPDEEVMPVSDVLAKVLAAPEAFEAAMARGLRCSGAVADQERGLAMLVASLRAQGDRKAHPHELDFLERMTFVFPYLLKTITGADQSQIAQFLSSCLEGLIARRPLSAQSSLETACTSGSTKTVVLLLLAGANPRPLVIWNMPLKRMLKSVRAQLSSNHGRRNFHRQLGTTEDFIRNGASLPDSWIAENLLPREEGVQ